MAVCAGLAGIIAALDDEQAAVFVKRHRDRGSNQGLCRDQFNAKTWLDAEARKRIRVWDRSADGQGIRLQLWLSRPTGARKVETGRDRHDGRAAEPLGSTLPAQNAHQ